MIATESVWKSVQKEFPLNNGQGLTRMYESDLARRPAKEN